MNAHVLQMPLALLALEAEVRQVEAQAHYTAVRSKQLYLDTRTIAFRMELKRERQCWAELRHRIYEAGQRIEQFRQARLV